MRWVILRKEKLVRYQNYEDKEVREISPEHEEAKIRFDKLSVLR